MNDISVFKELVCQMTHIMTSIPVTKVPKAKTKKTLKRLMLANLEEPILRTIDERADKLIENKLVSYLKEFKNRVSRLNCFKQKCVMTLQLNGKSKQWEFNLS